MKWLFAILYTYLYFRGSQGTWYCICRADFSWYVFMTANKPWTNMSGQMNIIWVSLPNKIKQNKLKTVYMWSCSYRLVAIKLGWGFGVCVCVWGVGVGVGVEAPPVLQKSYTIFMSFTIGFVIHKNLQKYVHDISNLMAAKWGRFNRQMSNSKMAAKTEDGGCQIGVSRL